MEVGNAYVNRSTTGAIVRRQPFGGWKRSSVGPGAKAGGPNYVARLGTWQPVEADLSDDEWLEGAQASDEEAWQAEFGAEHDPSGLFCESNIFRYRPLPKMVLRAEADAAAREVTRVRAAVRRCGVQLVESHAADETSSEFAARARLARRATRTRGWNVWRGAAGRRQRSRRAHRRRPGHGRGPD